MIVNLDKLIDLKAQFTAIRWNSTISGTAFAFNEEDILLEQYLTTTITWILRAMSRNAETAFHEQFGKPEDDEPESNGRRPTD